MLAPAKHAMSSSQRARVAALDVCVVTAMGLLVSVPAGFSPWIAIACCALVYYAGSTIWQGRTPVAVWLDDDGEGTAPRDVQRSGSADTQPMELALTFAPDDERDQAHATRERRSGDDRRRRSPRHDPPRHSDGVRLLTTPGTPSVH